MEKQYINSVFIKELKGKSQKGEPYEFQVMSINRDQFIDELLALETNEKGFIDFKINRQKKDASKFSMTVNDYRPSTPPPSQKSTPTAQSQKSSSGLPF